MKTRLRTLFHALGILPGITLLTPVPALSQGDPYVRAIRNGECLTVEWSNQEVVLSSEPCSNSASNYLELRGSTQEDDAYQISLGNGGRVCIAANEAGVGLDRCSRESTMWSMDSLPNKSGRMFRREGVCLAHEMGKIIVSKCDAHSEAEIWY